MKIYFDTNVFDHISKGVGVTETDLGILHSAVSSRRITVVLSYLNLEEVLGQLGKSDDKAQAQIRLILRLTRMRHFVKPADQLLADDIRCYAEGRPLMKPFTFPDATLRRNIRALARDKRYIEQLLPAIRETQKDKEDFRNGMKEAATMIASTAKLYLKSNHGNRPPWQDYWDRLADGVAEAFASGRDLDLCRARGIDGLLAVRSVRMAVGGSISYAYSETFEKRTPKSGDSRDLIHAVLATAADVFITHDKPLARLLNRIPQVCYEIKELPDVIKQIVD